MLLIGDIHFPDTRSQLDADIKDPTIDPKLRDAIAVPRLTRVVREVTQIQQKRPFDAILLVGDVTTQGDKAGYKEGLNFVCDALELKNRELWPESSIHIVVGNHDIERALVASSTQYVAAVDSVKEVLGGDFLSPSAPRSRTLSGESGVKVVIHSMNSCIGCGSHRLMPPKVKAVLEGLGASEFYSMPYEGLDTPAFEDNHIQEIVTSIEASVPSTVPVILCHHNVLPQATPRVAVYTEALNAGHLRARLLALGRPVILVHGHIHSDPIEIVQAIDEPASMLVCASALRLVDGFDVLTIVFSADGRPLGITTERFRIDREGRYKRVRQIYSFIQRPDLSKLSALDRELLDVLTNEPTSLDQLRAKISQSPHPQHKTLAAAAETLAWFGLATVQDQNYEFKRWRVSRGNYV
jgi:hypothetical protein